MNLTVLHVLLLVKKLMRPNSYLWLMTINARNFARKGGSRRGEMSGNRPDFLKWVWKQPMAWSSLPEKNVHLSIPRVGPAQTFKATEEPGQDLSPRRSWRGKVELCMHALRLKRVSGLCPVWQGESCRWPASDRERHTLDLVLQELQLVVCSTCYSICVSLLLKRHAEIQI